MSCRIIAIGAGLAGGGLILLVAIVSTAVLVCLILKKRMKKNLSPAQTVDYNSNKRAVEETYNINTDSNPGYKSTINHHTREAVYYDAISPAAGMGITELLDSNQDILEENMAYESSTAAQTDTDNHYEYM